VVVQEPSVAGTQSEARHRRTGKTDRVMTVSDRRKRFLVRRWYGSPLVPGVMLLTATLVALLWINASPDTFDSVWSADFGWGRPGLRMEARHWVNDALMTLFFFAIGLELKHELATGTLAHPRRAAVPIVAAIAGAAAPAAVFVAITWNTELVRGWGVPMATDPAFAVGVLALVAPGAPAGLRAMLLAIATVDDVIAVFVIATGYAAELSLVWLGAAAAGCGLVFALQRRGVARLWPYLLVGALVWWATLHSGVHATIAGVVLALLTPAQPVNARPLLDQLLRVVAPISAFIVVPIFALANAGVRLDAATLASATQSREMIAVLIGLVVGKLLGVSGAVVAITRFGPGHLPPGVRPGHVLALGFIAGLGFTVAFFVTELAYTDSAVVEHAKIGVLAASLIAAAAAALTILITDRRRSPIPEDATPGRP
jgi:NhaA family Na+:H+ antiporter